MFGVNLKENHSSKKSRVSRFKNNVIDGRVINNIAHFKMIMPKDRSSIKYKSTDSKKRKVFNPISLYKNKSSDKIIGKYHKDKTKTH